MSYQICQYFDSRFSFFISQTVKQRKVDVKATQDDLTMTIETFFDHELVSSYFFFSMGNREKV